MKITIPYTINRPSLSSLSLPTLTCVLLFLVSPYIDAITGFLVNRGVLGEGGAGTPSQLFRFFVTALMLVQIKDVKHWRITCFMLIWIITIECVNMFNHQNLGWLVLGIVYSYKLVFGLLVYFLFREYFNKGSVDFDKLQNYIISMTVSYVLIILFCDFAGLSSSSYPGANLGSKGPFAGGNGMGVFLGGASFVVLNKYIKNGGWKLLILYLLTVKVLFGLMSKAGLLFSLVGLLILFMRQNKWLKISVFALISGAVIMYWDKIAKISESAFSMIIWRMKRSDSIWEIVLGGREQYLAEMANYDYESATQIVKLIFGGGYKLSFRDPNSFYYDPNGIFIIEADFFDIYFMYGFFGIVLYFMVFYSGFKTPSSKGIYVIKTGWAILFIHSALAGHVMNNGAALLLLPCILILLQNYKDKYTQCHKKNNTQSEHTA